MFPDLVRFIHISTQSQFTAFQRKANAITGNVNIPVNVQDVVDALEERFQLKTVQISFARKLAYASSRHHYKYGTTMLEDILAGKRFHISSYR
jgi:putative uncharacterized protein gbs0243